LHLVGGGEHEDLAAGFDAVEQDEKLGEGGYLVLSALGGAGGSDGVYLVKEDDGWRANFCARSKTSRMAASVSPTHLDKRAGPFTISMCALHSPATARARRVFPVPGGPGRMMDTRCRGPLGNLTRRWNP
jgi:hypothetical protein